MPTFATRVPEVPVTLMINVPVSAELLAASVSVLVLVVGFVLNEALTPVGKQHVLSVTCPLKPYDGTTVIKVVPLLPRGTIT